jgi:excinuclease ABC subunit A
MKQGLEKHNSLIVKGARQHNLQSISVNIPHNSLTVVTGVSGSGKTSLVFDTIFAEGQRRYVESLSAYARQFLGRMPKPDVDSIEGLAPAIAIEQKVITRNPRSTVATTTEIYDYLKLLFVRLGNIYSPVSGNKVTKHTLEDVWQFILALPNSTRFSILFKPVVATSEIGSLDKVGASLLTKGFVRIYSENLGYVRIDKLNEVESSTLLDYYCVVDRLEKDDANEELQNRSLEAIETAFWEGKGDCFVLIESESTFDLVAFTDRMEADGLSFLEPDLYNMSFNSPAGACKKCEGLGEIVDIDPDLVIPDRSLSVFEDCVAPWKGEVMKEWKNRFLSLAVMDDFPLHRAYKDLTDDEKKYLWDGPKKNKTGITDFFKFLEEKSYQIQYRVLLSRYRGRTTCNECKGTKLRKEAHWVKIECTTPDNPSPFLLSMHDLLVMSVKDAGVLFHSLQITNIDNKASQRILTEIKNRLLFLNNVGLGYLTLHRLSNTLSGGESQRVRLATSLGSNLSGSLYILDEPTIGLHPKDTAQLITVLKQYQESGNTVVIVEHEEEVMKAADYLIDIGPEAGRNGGRVLFEGPISALKDAKNSLTADYLSGKLIAPKPEKRRTPVHFLTVSGAEENNLKDITVRFPLECLTVVSGVSGSGKTTLVKKILYPALQKKMGLYAGVKTGKHTDITGPIHLLKNIELIDQNPLGRSSRSNPVTYVKAWDSIRDLLSQQSLAKQRGYKPAFFSFNVEGGRCEQCKGEGEQTIEMQFMADILLPCEYCHGKRFKEEVLEVTYKDKNVGDILDLTIDEALEFFKDLKSVYEKLLPLEKVGLGYIKLGQSSNTLSGGEAQRVKLASYLGKGQGADPVLFIFDEPTTGLHFHDISKLLRSFSALIDNGHTIIVIEHNMDVINNADYLIDLGPEGGESGGNLVFEGNPDEILSVTASYTGQYLRKSLENKS